MQPCQDFGLFVSEDQSIDLVPANATPNQVTWSPIQDDTETSQGILQDNHEQQDIIDPWAYNAFEAYADPGLVESEFAYTINDITYPF